MATIDSQGYIRVLGSTSSVRSEFSSGRASPPAGARSQAPGRQGNSPNLRNNHGLEQRAESPSPPERQPVAGKTENPRAPDNSAERPAPVPPAKPERTRPKEKVDTSAETAISRLLHAIALKEAATARLIHVEVEKAERASRQAIGALSFDDVLSLHRSAADLIYAIAHKEELLVSKLNVLLAIVETMAGLRTGGDDEEEDPVRESVLFQGPSDLDTDP